MKQFCDSLMKLNSKLPFGDDFSPIVLVLFLKENGYRMKQKYEIYEFALYLYRFYSDVEELRAKHYNPLIKKISYYYPEELLSYSKSVLEYIAKNTGLITVGDNAFILANCPENIEKYNIITNNVMSALIIKYLGDKYTNYSTDIKDEEVSNNMTFACGSRVFNRAMENINYCFLCDEYKEKHLCAVSLQELKEFDHNNYLILCHKHAKMYTSGELVIKKNGYPYINGTRQFQHIEINALKKIRKYLSD